MNHIVPEVNDKPSLLDAIVVVVVCVVLFLLWHSDICLDKMLCWIYLSMDKSLTLIIHALSGGIGVLTLEHILCCVCISLEYT